MHTFFRIYAARPPSSRVSLSAVCSIGIHIYIYLIPVARNDWPFHGENDRFRRKRRLRSLRDAIFSGMCVCARAAHLRLSVKTDRSKSDACERPSPLYLSRLILRACITAAKEAAIGGWEERSPRGEKIAKGAARARERIGDNFECTKLFTSRAFPQS